MLITSRANPKIKRIRRLSRRKYRDRTGLYLVEGSRLLAEALRAHADISMLVVAPELLDQSAQSIVAEAQREAQVPALVVTPMVIASICTRPGRPGAVAVARQRWQRLEGVRPEGEACWVAVNEVRQPWSIGTIIRMCDAVGAAGVILIGDSTDPHDPVAVRASLGAVFSQNLVKTSFAEFAAWKRRHACFVVGTSPAAGTDYRQMSYPARVVLFMGSERVGLSPEQEAICDAMVRIPMIGRCPSHHVAVATGIVLYEIFNQRRASVASKREGRDHG